MSISVLDALMSQSFDSPPCPITTPAKSRKRIHSDDGSDKEDEAEDGFPTPANREGQTLFMMPTPLANANIVTFARRYGLSKLLKQVQMQELLNFVKCTLDEHFVMLYVAAMQTYSCYIMLSPKIRGYRDGVAQRLLWARTGVELLLPNLTDFPVMHTITRNLCWDIPNTVYSNPAATAKLDNRICHHFTQFWSTIKKKRAEYVTSSGKDFYNKVDKWLAKIRDTYPSPGIVTRSVLNHDIESHGHNNLHIEILAPADTQTDETERVVEHTIEGSNEAGVPLTDAAQSGPSTSSNQSLLSVSSTMAENPPSAAIYTLSLFVVALLPSFHYIWLALLLAHSLTPLPPYTSITCSHISYLYFSYISRIIHVVNFCCLFFTTFLALDSGHYLACAHAVFGGYIACTTTLSPSVTIIAVFSVYRNTGISLFYLHLCF
ncbi:uncharacterized protein LACBIDRAFT_334076 [Laccaria bicolor S238N-H82]|uniref:Predicted protein n=1 Tax=Laccaria bicolor (strain S238N-H82 / ATCC MYA-4686) TaxID=486041 RepID=B0DY04_LACBS|nr:uncharacterized protein LACBIDRAFT_334076 [Laccaria bicolor S238N-H82]EDR00601.1 predicted protein [Laccaria bicolor S238N-H82]|eukprot:XP_001888828.1 predicted protein [Laccaria bicolor S238N-H82]